MAMLSPLLYPPVPGDQSKYDPSRLYLAMNAAHSPCSLSQDSPEVFARIRCIAVDGYYGSSVRSIQRWRWLLTPRQQKRCPRHREPSTLRQSLVVYGGGAVGDSQTVRFAFTRCTGLNSALRCIWRVISACSSCRATHGHNHQPDGGTAQSKSSGNFTKRPRLSLPVSWRMAEMVRLTLTASRGRYRIEQSSGWRIGH